MNALERSREGLPAGGDRLLQLLRLGPALHVRMLLITAVQVMHDVLPFYRRRDLFCTSSSTVACWEALQCTDDLEQLRDTGKESAIGDAGE